ncbi:MAG: nuclear transport factor 2 family protein [Bacteroidia bacterium]
MKLIVLVTLLLTLSCERSKPFSDEDRKRIVNEVTQMLHDYQEAVADSGLTAEFAYLDSSSDFFWVPPGFSGPIDYDSVSKILKQNAPLFKSIESTYDTLRVVPLSKRIATYTAQLQSTMTDTSGKALQYTLVETGVVIKRENGWKLVSGQTR